MLTLIYNYKSIIATYKCIWKHLYHRYRKIYQNDFPILWMIIVNYC